MLNNKYHMKEEKHRSREELTFESVQSRNRIRSIRTKFKVPPNLYKVVGPGVEIWEVVDQIRMGFLRCDAQRQESAFGGAIPRYVVYPH